MLQERSQNVTNGGDKVNPKRIGEKLKTLRGEMSQEEFAKKIGTSASAIAMYEAGERVPRDKIKIQIAAFFGKSVGEIFFDEDVTN